MKDLEKNLTKEKFDYVQVEYRTVLSDAESAELSKVQMRIFGGTVNKQEAAEDFINLPYAHLLLKDGAAVVGFLDLHKSDGSYKGKPLSIGGLSIGILLEYRGRHYGYDLISRAMENLREQNYDIGFLAAATGTAGLYEKFGFKMLNTNYTWENVYGEIKTDNDGMVVPLRNLELFDEIQSNTAPIHIGKGYW